MELKIYNPQEAGFVQKIEWNFEELKKEVTAAAQSYASTVYTDDASRLRRQTAHNSISLWMRWRVNGPRSENSFWLPTSSLEGRSRS